MTIFDGADLSNANIRGAEILKTSFQGACCIPDGICMIGGVGRIIYGHAAYCRDRYIFYDAINDSVICGCSANDFVGNLDSFKKYIENIYGENGETPNPKLYKEHQVAINYFKACKELYY